MEQQDWLLFLTSGRTSCCIGGTGLLQQVSPSLCWHWTAGLLEILVSMSSEVRSHVVIWCGCSLSLVLLPHSETPCWHDISELGARAPLHCGWTSQRPTTAARPISNHGNPVTRWRDSCNNRFESCWNDVSKSPLPPAHAEACYPRAWTTMPLLGATIKCCTLHQGSTSLVHNQIAQWQKYKILTFRQLSRA